MTKPTTYRIVDSTTGAIVACHLQWEEVNAIWLPVLDRDWDVEPEFAVAE